MDERRIYGASLLVVNDYLVGEKVRKNSNTLADLEGVFQDKEAYDTLSPRTLLYEVESYLPVGPDAGGGLYFGVTRIYPGRVGNEYFMTRGHFHARIDRGEYYRGVTGQGVLILMDRHRRIWGEKMFPGSLHYIPGATAHRVANTGHAVLSFAACWPSDAGHNYREILECGFSASLQCVNGNPELVAL